MKRKVQKLYLKIFKFIDSAKFMASSLSDFVNNLAGGIHKVKWKCTHDNKKYITFVIKYKYCGCCLKYANVQDELIVCNCFF